MDCLGCGRPLRSPVSKAREYGPCCWEARLNELTLEEQQEQKMKGYAWFQAGDVYIVVTPKHDKYQIDPDLPGCECVAFEASNRRGCKHIDYLRRELEAKT